MSARDERIIGGAVQATARQAIRYFLDNPACKMTPLAVGEMIGAVWELGGRLGVRADRVAAQIAHETGRGAFTGDVSVAQRNPAGIGTTGGGVAGLSYPSWADGIAGYFVHLVAWLGGPTVVPAIGSLYSEAVDPRVWIVEKVRATKGAAITWADLGGRWAVPGNGYGDALDRHLAGILAIPKEGTMGHVPKPPITDLVAATMAHKVAGVGFDAMDHDRVPKGTILHSMGGTLKGTSSYFAQPTTKALTDFGIGQTEHPATPGFAEIRQWCDIYGRAEPWASGPVKNPEGDGPAFLAAFGGADGLNEHGVAIEHDDTTREDGGTGQVGGVAVTRFQWAASVWLQAWLHAEVLGQTADTYQWNMWHREFCGAAYKTCPNPRITDHVEEYQGAVMAIMRHFQEGVAYPAGGLSINGLAIATPPEGGSPVPPAIDTAKVRWYLNDLGEPVVEINFGGRMQSILGVSFEDIGVSGIGMDGAIYDRSLQHGVFGPYNRRRPE